MRKSLEKREEKRQKVVESDQTSLLINDDKNIGEIKYQTLLAEKNLKHFFAIINKQAKKHQQPRHEISGPWDGYSLLITMQY